MNSISSIMPAASTASANIRSTQADVQQGSFLEALRNSDSRPTQKDDEQLRDKFTEFFGQTLFGQALSSMRKTVDKPKYFDGGRAEEVFQEQLDKQLVEHVTESAGERFTQPMFELFTLQRR